ncbi:short-chain dehydrogenase/reductase [Chryseobacterium shigense]|uniref:Short-chain dehydrogenase n=1 Tax=Chryseobacterium shigense TaxID=297244 RepID=A0A1N7I879_9FLAO|nr:oxidoreductase [Chryseobacterium shigense]PQA96993.1 short-chain dehydrogenase/reductase [Chryseobacterium shigense]SIS33277.1 Short-chain dehydrogenase [Chryseobacterium shigense]
MSNQKVWFITGCSTGFGRELAKAVLQKGDYVVVTARNKLDIKDIVDPYPDSSIACALDVTNAEQIDESVKIAIERFGKIDILVNNAGIGYFSTIEESDEREVRKMFEINYFGLIQLTSKVLPYLRKEKSGFIVNFSSIGGLMSFPSVGHYNATKFAVEGYSEALSKELVGTNIKVLIVEPGPFRTDWAGRSAVAENIKISEYSDTSAVKDSMREGSGKEAGDPVRAAHAIIEVVESTKPPLRLLLGEIALNNAYVKLGELKNDFDNWKDLTLSADFPK